MFSLTIAEKSFIEKINKKYESSQIEIIQDLIPFLKVLTDSLRRQLKNISAWLNLDVKVKKFIK